MASAGHSFDGWLVFCDGASSGNPGAGGWGAIVVSPTGDVQELGGAADFVTNNQMEIEGAIRALDYIGTQPGVVTIYTDSTYVIRGITQWIWGWRQRNWITAEGNPVLNKELWNALSGKVASRKEKVHWLYSRGHSGIPGNERCDEIAVGFRSGKRIKLYRGPLLQYDVAIFDLPESSDLPEMREKKTAAQKAEEAARSWYLSYVSGEVWRHRDWPSCERRIKGQSGAKCKKVQSLSQEKDVLNDWRVSTSQSIKGDAVPNVAKQGES